MAKPLPLTPEITQDILALVADGWSVRKACAEYGILPQTFRGVTRTDDELYAQYVRAREYGMHAQADEMQDLESAVLSGEMDPNRFKAALDGRKWRMAKQFPERYGDSSRVQVEQKTELSGEVKVKAKLPDSILEMIEANKKRVYAEMLERKKGQQKAK